jgi:hypothetical protein
VPVDVRINEVVARNQSTWDDGTMAFPDWVELYNAGDHGVVLSTLVLTDGEGEWRVPDDGVLPPGARVVVGLGAAGFGVGEGETVTLSDASGVLDRVTPGAFAPDVAWARLPDGGPWGATTAATPGSANPTVPSSSLDTSDTAFGWGTLHRIDLALDDAAVAGLTIDRLSPVAGAVTIDGVRYAPVGVRLKSTYGSARELDEKPGWKVDLNAYADLTWRGQKGLTLNNLVQDPTCVREHLAYRLFRAVGVPAPRVGWAVVTLNGLDYGLSLLVETADERFLSRWYADPSGALYEGSHGVDLRPGQEARFEYDEGPDPDDRADLTAAIAALTAPPDDTGVAGVEALVDVEEVLTYLAAEALAVHWDGYRNTNNYRIYHDPSDRLELLPWGTDNTFERGGLDPWAGDGVLLSYCLANAACAARYDARLVEVADVLDGLALDAEAAEVAAWLRPAIAVDPRREYDLARHDAELTRVEALLVRWPEEVRGRVAAKR